MNSSLKPWRRRALLWTAVAVAAWILLRMFEPVLGYSFGWQTWPAQAEPAVRWADPAWQDPAAAADAALLKSRRQLDAPALSAAVMVNGQRVWAGAVGMADLEAQTPVDLETRFRLGSTSKAVNGFALGLLMEHGRIDIDQPLRTYLPELPAAYEAVTTRQAISHRAGVPDYGFCLCFPIWEHRNQRHFTGVREALAVFTQRPLLFTPGEDFRYSSYGANLAGAAIEVAAHQPYTEFVTRSVFGPLAMSHSGFDIKAAVDPHRAAFYEVAEGRYKPADPVDNSIRYPSGGMLSTPSDMLLLGRAWFEGELLSPASRAQLLTVQPLKNGKPNPQGYALGMRVAEGRELLDGQVKTRMLSHHGTAVGSTSYFAIFPEYGMVVAVMMNKGQEDLKALAPEAHRLAEIFLAARLSRKP
ncbi:beta-lactamase family protein [Pelomonas sp. V22]|uniref:serine hydrolase domain-containing protein n=1 Tax=Pelomonas sp. V22 TaxID=2822139 RepID=UPI0024A7E98E|nr:serine hydrolase domain-containing protein [Pelomonas sp. V22]MDI4634984.1 beta-lactamase family protein [Pelomonas sp. V22]